jgi:protoporphyrinogen/coproporphyrinogen III oxidase
MTLDAIIIGAGLSGLVAAYRLQRLGRNVLLLESSNRIGGVMQTIDADGFLLEKGPNSLRGTHEFLDLVEELGLMAELITADPRAPAYVFTNGQLHAVPMSPLALVKTKLISNAAKLRLLREPFVVPPLGGMVVASAGIPPKGGTTNAIPEESIASFVRRRLGHEVLDKLVAPFLSGVYAGDPEQLSVQACFPKLVEFESEAGSIMRGAWRAARSRKQQPARRSLRPYRLCGFQRGLQTLPQRLARELGANLLTGAQVTNIQINNASGAARFVITIEESGATKTLDSAALVMATPAYVAAQLLAKPAPDVAVLVGAVSYVSLVSVPLAYQAEQVARQLDGFGFLAPRSAGLRTLGSIWNSSLFAERAPAGWLLTTNYIGGATDPAAINLSDEELIRIVQNDLSKVLGIIGEPRQLPITRYERAIPQYNLGHAARVAKLEATLHNHPGLHLAGNYLRGVSLGDCIKQAEALATAINQNLATSQTR